MKDKCEAPGCRQVTTTYCMHCFGTFCPAHLRVIIGDMRTPSETVCEECYCAHKQADSATIQGH